jgi:ketosteroid isomerase-like protein
VEQVVVTRVESNGPLRRSRDFQERLMVRFPGAFRRVAPLMFRLGPRSRLRRALLRRVVLSGWASFDRRDYEVNLLYFAADAEFEFPAGMQTLGLDATYRGHEGRIEALNKIFEIWGSELEPAYMLDLGDRVLTFGIWHTRAHASEVMLDQELAQLATVRNGLVARDQTFFSWDEALRAAGLDPGGMTLPRPTESR